MAQSLLRQIVAGPRARHTEAGLDLAYITDNLVATSGPSATYPERAYRNPLDQLVKFLDEKHGSEWAIWEYRAEGTGYPDSEVYDRIWHFPWPDHHPPPFALVPRIMASMRNWLRGDAGVHAPKVDGVQVSQGRVVVGHCKAGKGRTGSMFVSYLISQEGWTREAALQRFSERRMRPGMGAGVSIPSQLRWLSYVERWSDNGKIYVDQAVEITEVHVWGLRDGVKIAIEGYEDEGKRIKTMHVFKRHERDDAPDGDESTKSDTNHSIADVAWEVWKGQRKKKKSKPDPGLAYSNPSDAEPSAKGSTSELSQTASDTSTSSTTKGKNTVFRPKERIILPSSDINLAAERRSKAAYGWTMVTSVAHVWFNTFFEGNGPEQSKPLHGREPNESAAAFDRSGLFEITWDAMDGIKGSSKKGVKAFDKIGLVWRVVEDPSETSGGRAAEQAGEKQLPTENKEAVRPPQIITEPGVGEHVASVEGADWKGQNVIHDERTPNLSPKDSQSVVTSPETAIDSNMATAPKLGEAAVRAARLEASSSQPDDVGGGSRIARTLGLRPEEDHSVNVSKAGSLKSVEDSSERETEKSEEEDGAAGIQRGMQLPRGE